MANKFNVDDRVKFPRDVYEYPFVYMHGVVTKVYSKYGGFFYPELYDVQFDNGKFQQGYLPHGLQAE